MDPQRRDNEEYSESWEEKSRRRGQKSWLRMLSRRSWISMAIILVLLVLALALGLDLGSRAHADGQDVVVDLGYSKYRGKSFKDGTSHWLGMRYAAAPLGNLRFAAPRDPESTKKIQPANTSGPRCLSTRKTIAKKPATLSGRSEDCLFVDVYAPSHATKGSKLPVYVFIQGGGFNDNSGNGDGKNLVKASEMKIIVVTFNYRVGPYGFLAGSEVEKGGSLNNGLKDQRQLLLWVQRHIEKVSGESGRRYFVVLTSGQFGGDANHVVLGGASAGGGSVTLQLVAYGGRDDKLFHATAAESQSFGALRTVAESQYQYDELVQRTNCTAEKTGKSDTLACLRTLDIDVLQSNNIGTKFPGAKVPPLFPYNPTLDHDFIQDYTITLFQEGRFLKLPAIYGDTTNEGTIFVNKKTATVEEFEQFVQAQFPAINSTQLKKLAEHYPPKVHFPKSGKYWRSTSNAYGDLRYVCPGMFLNDMYKRRNVSGNFNYRFNVASTSQINSGIGVAHVAELGALWGSADGHLAFHQHLDTSTEVNVPLLMQKYWTSFILTFDPNTFRYPGSPRWEEWTADGRSHGNAWRLLIESGANATRMEFIDDVQRLRCTDLINWGVSLKQ